MKVTSPSEPLTLVCKDLQQDLELEPGLRKAGWADRRPDWAGEVPHLWAEGGAPGDFVTRDGKGCRRGRVEDLGPVARPGVGRL